ncbi:MAG: hypothetical protein JST58_19820 [Bacteroidetes bacterium]|nr:hypothetical protein [Bacteroidota bacterium]
MRPQAEIWNELTEISPTVAKISNDNVFEAPNGYFENFASAVLSMIEAGSVKSEMESLSGLLSQSIGKPSPFRVPQGYFDGFSESLIKKLQSANEATPIDEEISPILHNADKQISFTVPTGYFENFATNLLDKIKASNPNEVSQELKEIAPSLENLVRDTSFSLPNGYFENFSDSVMSRIKAAEAHTATSELENLSPLLSSIGKKLPFSMPDGYFSGLSENIVGGAKAVDFVNDELENHSPLMESLRNKSTYEAPIGYFKTLPESILLKVAKQPAQAKVVSIQTKRNWLRYAAAAIVVGIIASSTLFVLNYRKPYTALAKLDASQLADSLHNTKDEDILNYLQSHNVPIVDSSSNNMASLDLTEATVDDMLADVPDSELQQYVNDHYSIKELPTN